MNNLQRLLSNTALAFLGSLIAKASNTVLFILLGRALGPTPAGIFNLGITYYVILLGLSAFGLHELLVRELTPKREQSQRYLVTYLTLRLVLALLAYFALWLWLTLFTPYAPLTQQVILVVALVVFPEAIFNVCQAFFEAHERLRSPTAVAATSGLLKITIGVVAIWRGVDLYWVAWLVPLGSAVSLLIFIPPLKAIWRAWPYTARFDLSFVWHQLRQTPNFFVIHLFSLLDYQTDTFLLSLFLSETHVGWYGASQTILLAFWSLPVAIRAAIYPVMVRYYRTDQAALRTFYRQTSRYLLLAILPMAAGVFILAQPLIDLLFGSGFEPAVAALQWSIGAVIGAVVIVPSARLLIVTHRQREAAWITGASMVCNVLGNVWLIPRYGVVGAAMARLVSTLLFCLLIYLFVQTVVLRHNLLPLFWRPLLATAVMSLAIWPWRTAALPLVVLTGAGVYAVTLFLIGGLSRADLHYLRQIVPLKMG